MNLKRLSFRRLVILLLIILVGAFVCAVFSGAEKVTLRAFIESFKALSGPRDSLSGMNSLIWMVRFPRILLALLAGALLSSSGVVFQGVFLNPLADPYLLGVSSGAAFGVALARTVFGNITGILSVSMSAFAGALGASLLVFLISGGFRARNTVYLLLTGLAIGFLLSGLVSFLVYMNRNDIEAIIFWMMGSFGAASWSRVLFLVVTLLPGCFILMLTGRDLNILAMGEESAAAGGMNVPVLRLVLLATATVMAAAAVAVCGIISFAGLIIPHAVRFLTGPDHRRLVPASLLAGGLFMIITDTISRTILAPAQVPISVITSLIGGPYFIMLIYRRGTKWQ
ncbi:MAG: iron ABC transporter permease [Spirochaetales bacterium]|nr:iron ABC transporter permease [Spirochaetales bacterium]